jgi:hypothetical protein
MLARVAGLLKVILTGRFQRSEDHGVDDYAVVAAS